MTGQHLQDFPGEDPRERMEVWRPSPDAHLEEPGESLGLLMGASLSLHKEVNIGRGAVLKGSTSWCLHKNMADLLTADTSEILGTEFPDSAWLASRSIALAT